MSESCVYDYAQWGGSLEKAFPEQRSNCISLQNSLGYVGSITTRLINISRVGKMLEAFDKLVSVVIVNQSILNEGQDGGAGTR